VKSPVVESKVLANLKPLVVAGGEEGGLEYLAGDGVESGVVSWRSRRLRSEEQVNQDSAGVDPETATLVLADGAGAVSHSEWLSGNVVRRVINGCREAVGVGLQVSGAKNGDMYDVLMDAFLREAVKDCMPATRLYESRMVTTVNVMKYFEDNGALGPCVKAWNLGDSHGFVIDRESRSFSYRSFPDVPPIYTFLKKYFKPGMNDEEKRGVIKEMMKKGMVRKRTDGSYRGPLPDAVCREAVWTYLGVVGEIRLEHLIEFFTRFHVQSHILQKFLRVVPGWSDDQQFFDFRPIQVPVESGNVCLAMSDGAAVWFSDADVLDIVCSAKTAREGVKNLMWQIRDRQREVMEKDWSLYDLGGRHLDGEFQVKLHKNFLDDTTLAWMVVP
jgi:hypothetical protein